MKNDYEKFKKKDRLIIYPSTYSTIYLSIYPSINPAIYLFFLLYIINIFNIYLYLTINEEE